MRTIKKRLLPLLLALALCMGLLPTAALAAVDEDLGTISASEAASRYGITFEPGFIDFGTREEQEGYKWWDSEFVTVRNNGPHQVSLGEVESNDSIISANYLITSEVSSGGTGTIQVKFWQTTKVGAGTASLDVHLILDREAYSGIIGGSFVVGGSGGKLLVIKDAITVSWEVTEKPEAPKFEITDGVLTKYLDYTDEVVVIPDTVTEIGPGVFANSSRVTSVIIPNSVTKIGDKAFKGCGLTSLTIPSSVTEIGSEAFYSCKNLTSLTIPGSVKKIGTRAFRYCPNVTDVTLENGIEEIGDGAFYDCRKLTSINIPGSVKKVDKNAFGYCDNLASVTLERGVEEIGGSAFYNCKNLANVTFPDTLTTIGARAFVSCKALTGLTIPGSVKQIGEQAFSNCDGLTSVTFESGADGIGPYVFMHCKALTSADIPDSVKQIGERPFHSCTNLTIYGVPGSYAETFAKQNGIAFAASGTPSTPSIPTFTDVPSWFTTEVGWAAANGITFGYGDGRFGTDDNCTNPQILTFLWRAAGKQNAKAKSPFTVQSSYQDAVDWAYGEGVIDGSFDANGYCTRASAMEYIWKAFGRQPAAAGSSFVDVPADAPYAAAVNWGVAKGLTKGYGNNDFQPSNICSRGEIAAFLYRAYN